MHTSLRRPKRPITVRRSTKERDLGKRNRGETGSVTFQKRGKPSKKDVSKKYFGNTQRLVGKFFPYSVYLRSTRRGYGHTLYKISETTRFVLKLWKIQSPFTIQLDFLYNTVATVHTRELINVSHNENFDGINFYTSEIPLVCFCFRFIWFFVVFYPKVFIYVLY